ncbi:Translation initiation factor IF-1 [Candidatus Hodgkinia cicadicola]|nr:Translation initiation factor IF-1 [Candidatus Hodgkinia cicadicola]
MVMCLLSNGLFRVRLSNALWRVNWAWERAAADGANGRVVQVCSV